MIWQLGELLVVAICFIALYAALRPLRRYVERKILRFFDSWQSHNRHSKVTYIEPDHHSVNMADRPTSPRKDS
jgi:hypothetical protein